MWWHRDCDCTPEPVTVQVTIADAGGNIRAVREAQFLLLPHGKHPAHGRHEREG